MTKNKWIALAIILVVFLLFFQSAFDGESASTVWGLISFVIVVFGSIIALFIGNNETSK